MENQEENEQNTIQQEEQSTEEKLNEVQDETSKGEKVVHMPEATGGGQEEITAESIDQKEAETKEEERVEQSQTMESSKKTKQTTSKQNPKLKLTVPKPFSLETEKRMSRQRRGSMDFNASNPLSKSASVNYKNLSRPLPCAESTLDRTATKTSLRPKVSTHEQVDKKGKEGNDVGSSKFRKSSTFKALPLPRFYHQNNNPAPKSETRKETVKEPKSPLEDQQSKSVTKIENDKREDKGKKVSKTVSSSAKETIGRILKTTRSTLSTRKEMAKAVVSRA